MTFDAVILAGGKSSRMGRDKAFLDLGGETLLARQVALARTLGAEEVFIAGRAGVDYSSYAAHALLDKYQQCGPLAGIQRALDACRHPLLLVLAVDLPHLEADDLRRLLRHCRDGAGAIPQTGGQIQPLAAVYPRAAQSLAESNLKAARNSAVGFAEACVRIGLARLVKCSAQDEASFANWNSPGDIAVRR